MRNGFETVGFLILIFGILISFLILVAWAVPYEEIEKHDKVIYCETIKLSFSFNQTEECFIAK